MVHLLKESLKTLHPFMPFVSEELWQKLEPDSGSLSTQPWPSAQKGMVNKISEKKMQVLLNVITAIRTLRVQWNIDANQKIECIFQAQEESFISLFEQNSLMIRNLIKAERISVHEQFTKPKGTAAGIYGKVKFYVPLSGLIDIEKEKTRLLKQLQNQQNALQALSNRLKNKVFMKKAPADVITKEKSKQKNLQEEIEQLNRLVSHL